MFLVVFNSLLQTWGVDFLFSFVHRDILLLVWDFGSPNMNGLNASFSFRTSFKGGVGWRDIIKARALLSVVSIGGATGIVLRVHWTCMRPGGQGRGEEAPDIRIDGAGFGSSPGVDL